MTTTPYADSAPEYQRKGWSPIPLPYGRKKHPPTGWTGYGAPMASGADVAEWASNGKAGSNIAVRLPDGVIGIDVDAYGRKAGLQTMLDAVDRLGPLPKTYRSGNRDDGVSTIAYYRVPTGRRWADTLGDSVEIIHHGHRYAMVAPSLHPEGRTYRWSDPDGNPCEAPAIDDLPELPAAWVVELDCGSAADRPSKADVSDTEVLAYLAAMPEGEPCRWLRTVLDEAHQALRGAQSRHDTARNHLLRIVRAGEQHHVGAGVAMDTLESMWLESLASGQSRDPDRGEWHRMVAGAVGLVTETPSAVADKGCCGSDAPTGETPETVTDPTPRTLAEVRSTFRHWLGDDYDTAVLDAVLCAAASDRLAGDPAWLLVVSGSGAAKTETVQALAGAGAHVTSTVSGEGALLSGTARKERSKDATGGLLRKVGSRGVLVIKDVTSVLSMNRDTRGLVLAALREVYDGFWERNMGADGGRTLTWQGRLVVIGAVTTAWDSAHAVIATMGDRFLLVRLDSAKGRQRSGRQAIRNAGDEATMRSELSVAVAGLLAGVDPSVDLALTDAEVDRMLALADIVTQARTAVERDYRGDVIDAHAPEMPTRFAKQLTMIIRGGLALGMDRDHAMAIACRCAHDSARPLRLSILLDLLDNPDATTHAVRVRLERPRATVDRELQALHMLGLVHVDEITDDRNRTTWHYRIADGIDNNALHSLRSAKNVSTPPLTPQEESENKAETKRVGSDIPGTTPERRPESGLSSADDADTPMDEPVHNQPSTDIDAAAEQLVRDVLGGEVIDERTNK